jgi:hypothetical protein
MLSDKKNSLQEQVQKSRLKLEGLRNDTGKTQSALFTTFSARKASGALPAHKKLQENASVLSDASNFSEELWKSYPKLKVGV